MCRWQFAAAVVSLVTVGAPLGRAQVSDFDWAFEYTPFNGWAEQELETFHIQGPDNSDSADPPHVAWVSTVAPVAGHVSVTADFVNNDYEFIWDAPVFVVNGELRFYYPWVWGYYPTGQYQLEADVLPGDTFGFGVWSADAAKGSGDADFHSFVFTPVTWTDAGHALDPREWLTLAPPPGLPDFGASVGALGDLDGDSRPDFAVGAPTGDRVVVVSGADGSLLLEIAGPPDFGEVVRGAGDVNGDGKPDILVGMPKADTAGADSGRVEVRSGADGSLLFAVDGDAANAALGSSVASARDLTGDGLDDVIVGAPHQWPDAAPGYALLLAGPAGALIHRFDGVSIGFGTAVSGLGDADGDGTRDVLVSDPAVSGIRVLSGASFGTIATTSNVWPGVTETLSTLGDVDGDGRPDFVWGHPTSLISASGFVLVVSGATGATLAEIAGSNHFDTLGYAVAGGDFDGDGTPDVALQSRHHSDPEVGRVRILSGASGFSEIHELRAGPGDFLGAALATADGLDGDSAADLAIGAPGGLGLRLLHALDGNGVPRLQGTGDLSPSSAFTVELEDARALAPCLLIASPTRVDLPAKGGVLVPFPTLMLPLTTDAAGDLTLSSTWPPAIPGGLTLWMQAWVRDTDGPFGFSASNGLGGETP
ncbi:MAG TPA: FG-GAP-like repeat-containing protein [Planctomycetota bacterium]|nr:FG-GAP-like repeat-containing protein [Planctomycetota bacterium]